MEQEFSVWVGGLSADVDHFSFHKLFASKYSTVKSAKVVLDEFGYSKGFGFVKFTSQTDQQDAVYTFNGHYGLGSKPLKICTALPKNPVVAQESNVLEKCTNLNISNSLLHMVKPNCMVENKVLLECQTAQPANNTSKIRLSGAARKRFRSLLAAGLDLNEAYERCRTPGSQFSLTKSSQEKKVLKRKHSEEELKQCVKKAPKITIELKEAENTGIGNNPQKIGTALPKTTVVAQESNILEKINEYSLGNRILKHKDTDELTEFVKNTPKITIDQKDAVHTRIERNPQKKCTALPKTTVVTQVSNVSENCNETAQKLTNSLLHIDKPNCMVENHVLLECETAQSADKTRKKRLSGAARRRLRSLLAAGLELNEAYESCCKPKSQICLTNSRQGNNDLQCNEVLEEYVKKAPKNTTKVNVSKNNFCNVANISRLGIRSKSSMSDEQMKAVHQSLLLLIKNMNERGCGPKFLSFSHKVGWILVTCANKDSQHWLVENVQNIQPWPGAELSIIPENELPKPIVVSAFIPKSEAESIEQTLQYLRIQNDGFNTEHWRVLYRGTESPTGHTVAFTIDEPSAEALKSKQGKANFGFKIITFKIKGCQFNKTSSGAKSAQSSS